MGDKEMMKKGQGAVNFWLTEGVILVFGQQVCHLAE